MSTIESINSVLSSIESEIPSVRGTIVASGDGFVITDTLKDEAAEEVAAMVATTTGVGERMAATLSAGAVNETSIMGEERSIFLYRTGEEGVLAVIAEGDANVGMINIRAREAAKQIETHLTEPSAA